MTRAGLTPSRTTGWTKRKLGTCATRAYALIAILAITFDLATDRSFGAVMLAVVPISVVALVCLLVGPWLEGESRRAAWKAWLVGAGLVLLITTGFALLGASQAKAGELVFTYAAMLMALPASLVLPFAAGWADPLLGGNVLARILAMWAICAVSGALQWKALVWLYTGLRCRMRR